MLDSGRTVVHLCTPPDARTEALRELAALGFRTFLVEKPLSAGIGAVHEIRRIRDAHGLRITVVAPWLHSTLTQRLADLVQSGALGTLHSITVCQNKPRLSRTFAVPSHPSAFDVEPPHALGVALRLAGPARLVDASWTDAHLGDRVARRMGSARLRLQHDGGTTTTIACDLMSPVRERSIRLTFAGGTVTGYYPVSADDAYAQLSIEEPGVPERREVFYDEALTACVLRAYRDIADGADFAPAFELNAQVVSLLTDAKRRAAAESPYAPLPERAVPEEEALHAR
ncbi:MULTISPECIES: hypothetical protein [unclassified Streptomyces]|jgi:predicted dehydrogenase|uniref:hypothetical protein n=1 Tax=unclassified Streptomyces TaxID=2593676 RepID=UPI000A1E03F6|nr:hypothetical protein [Streptomyces sp. 13-12-16]OSP43637.1 hypothetical protein B7767_09005 [Streptomyces sp. 13-12-16]